MAIKAVVFDLDGTLIDGREMIFAQWEGISKHYLGAPLSRERIASEIYGSFDEIMKRVLNTEDPDLIAQAMVTFAEVREAVKHLASIYDGVHDTLQTLHDHGFKIAAYTNSDRKTIAHLEEENLLHFFDFTITAEEVTKCKPDPQGLYVVLEHLGVEPAHAAMIGDMPADIEMGKRAEFGLTVGITHGFGTRESLTAARPNAIVDGIPSILALPSLSKMV